LSQGQPGEANKVMAKAAKSEVPRAAAPAMPDDPRERYFNRELSWLAFNWRVLAEADNEHQPLLERLRFLSISGSNLDEFFMVRVAGLKGQVGSGVTQPSLDGRTPAEQLYEVTDDANRLMDEQQAVWRRLRAALGAAGIGVVGPADLGADDIAWLRAYFLEQVFPVLTPLAIDPAHPFPFLANRGFALVMQLVGKNEGRGMRALVPLPQQIRRFVRLPGEDIRLIPLEQLVELFVDHLFPGFRVAGRGTSGSPGAAPSA
jgi:polyphosphate kinase